MKIFHRTVVLGNAQKKCDRYAETYCKKLEIEVKYKDTSLHEGKLE